MKVMGIAIAAVGYVLAIGGTFVLFGAMPPMHPQGVAPVGRGEDVQAQIRSEMDAISRYRTRSRWATAVILIGTTLQLVGTVVAGVAKS
jgi:hypothetical protein